MTASVPPELGRRVAEPFCSDPDFWRSVCASADAVVLLAVAVVAAGSLLIAGASMAFVWLPFALPAAFLFRAAVSSSRFHRGHSPLPGLVDILQGEQSWRDAERTAVAAVFGRAVVRSRRRVGARQEV